jgi:hypothetical protein
MSWVWIGSSIPADWKMVAPSGREKVQKVEEERGKRKSTVKKIVDPCPLLQER